MLVLRGSSDGGSSGGGSGCSGGGDGCSGMLMFIVVIVILMIPSSFLKHNPVKSPGNQGCLDCLLKALHPGRAVTVDHPISKPMAPGELQVEDVTISHLEGTLSIDSQLQCLPFMNV